MTVITLKGHGNEPDFRFFLIRSHISPLHNLSSRSDFGFEFAEIFVIKNWLPAINDTGRSCGLCVSMISRVADFTHQRCGKLMTPCIGNTGSRLLKSLKENSPYWWCGKLSTPRITVPFFCLSLMRGRHMIQYTGCGNTEHRGLKARILPWLPSC